MSTTNSDFEQSSRKDRDSLIREFYTYLVESKKWWLFPVFLVFGLLGFLAIFASTGVAPFIYTLF